MKRIVIVLALIAGGVSIPAYADPKPYPLAGTWQITLTGGDLQSLAYEPQQHFLWEFELLPSGAYDVHIYAYSWDGKPYRTMTQSLNPDTPRTGNLNMRTTTDASGTTVQVDYQVQFDFSAKTVQGQYGKQIAFAFTGFTSRHYGWVNGRKITPEQTKLPEPLPKTPSFYEEEKRLDEQYKACERCGEEHRRACTWARDINRKPKERARWQTICDSECKACEGQGC